MNRSDIKYKRLDPNMDHHSLDIEEDPEGSPACGRGMVILHPT